MRQGCMSVQGLARLTKEIHGCGALKRHIPSGPRGHEQHLRSGTRVRSRLPYLPCSYLGSLPAVPVSNTPPSRPQRQTLPQSLANNQEPEQIANADCVKQLPKATMSSNGFQCHDRYWHEPCVAAPYMYCTVHARRRSMPETERPMPDGQQHDRPEEMANANADTAITDPSTAPVTNGSNAPADGNPISPPPAPALAPASPSVPVSPRTRTTPGSPRAIANGFRFPGMSGQLHSRRPALAPGQAHYPGAPGSYGMVGVRDRVPMRHPRPYTHAEIHLEMEREEESFVSPVLPPFTPFYHPILV